MQQIYPEIQRLGGEILAVSFSPPAKVAYFLSKYPLPFPVVSDPTGSAYKTFTLGRTNLRALLRPGVVWHYLRLMLGGWRPTRPDQDADIWQLGGNFILDRAGRLRYAHASMDPSDRPSNDVLLSELRAASATA